MKAVKKLASAIWDRFFKNRGGSLTLRAGLSGLYPGSDIRRVERERGIEVISNILLAILLTAVLSLAAFFAEERVFTDGQSVKRPKSGQGEALVDTIVTISATGSEIPVVIGIDEVKLTGEAKEELFEGAFSYLEKAVLGDNPDADHVTKDLSFVTAVPGTAMTAEWVSYDTSCLYPDGRLKTEKLTWPTVVELTVKLMYFDETRYRIFAICLCPLEEEEDFAAAAADAFEEKNREAPESECVELPATVGGERVSWKQKTGSSAKAILVLGLVAAAMIVPAMDAELKRKLKKREEELLRDYPDIVSKLILLMSAGMTVRGAWERISAESGSGYALKEMKITMNEIRLGASEAGAYERFGSRVGLQAYKKLGTILSRNLRRGNRDLLPLLELEAAEAFAIRKERVRLKGEEAGTKLLIPMIGMMCIVIAIVVVPAFAGFN